MPKDYAADIKTKNIRAVEMAEPDYISSYAPVQAVHFVMNKTALDLYTDYLMCSFGLTTAAGLAELQGGTIRHDRITRFLSKPDFTSAHL